MTFARTAILLAAAPLVWALHFATVYGFAGVACARGLGTAVPWAVGIATVVAAAACAALVVAGWRRRNAFEAWMASMLAALALVAIAWEALAAMLVKPCA
jgi:hypothetical protein